MSRRIHRPAGRAASGPVRGAPRITAANRKWWILATMTGSLSMVLIDETVVSVALPTIQRELDMSQTELQWVVNAYLLALAAFVAVGGRLAEMFGQGRVFKIGAVVFLVASAACGFAESHVFLIAAAAPSALRSWAPWRRRSSRTSSTTSPIRPGPPRAAGAARARLRSR